MFTGIVEVIGRVTETQRRGDLLLLTIASVAALTDMAVGDSICVNGACLTISALRQGGFEADCSPETFQRTNLGSLRPHDEVNLERALKVSDRLGGHLVTGHVDGTGYINEVTRGSGSMTMAIRVPQEFVSYLVEKGSVAVEGVSLTVSKSRGDEFQVVLIPYTAGNTTLGQKRVGDRVNIEVDIIGKYVKRFVQQGASGIDEGFLAEHGFDRE
ncbi:MAG: riboflavin synthase subunit alpha [Deltaproteobacteria bacterium RBG_13_52_11]|nr:MAG: riboflavin synthase subunit alpha [Deltaproteobacteria bacterium RBG_13_52_11]